MSHPDLITRIDRLHVPHGQLALWSLGQCGFAIKGGNTLFYVDPYLSDRIEEVGGPRRRFPIPADPARITHAQAVFATHEHMDHADGPTLGPLMAASQGAVLVTSFEGRDVALQAGVPDARIVVPKLGERVQLGDLYYTPIPAAHYGCEVRETGHARYMGFLFELNGVSVYHAGDTIFIPELLSALEGKTIDLALLPINGRDFHRERQGLVGNLWPGEAVELAQLIGAKVLIGTHNDLFDGNRVNPGLLFDELDRRAPFQRCHLLQPGELYLFAE